MSSEYEAIGFFDGSWDMRRTIGMGCVIKKSKSGVKSTLSSVMEISKGVASANVAEYMSLLMLLKHCLLVMDIKRIKVVGDSQLVVNQVNGSYQVKKPHLKRLRNEVLETASKFEKIDIVHIPRRLNKADPYSKIK